MHIIPEASALAAMATFDFHGDVVNAKEELEDWVYALVCAYPSATIIGCQPIDVDLTNSLIHISESTYPLMVTFNHDK
jgi:hypothetical protein